MREQPRQRPSKQAFEALYDRGARRLLVYLVRRMHDVDAATELWAECWALAFEGWQRCKAGAPAEEEAWVFGIARNQLAAYYRTGAIRQAALERLNWSTPTVTGDEYAGLEREAELMELRGLLSAALAELPEARRLAIRLRVISGMPYPDVAARLGCSEQTARAHVSRGLRRLQRTLDRQQLTDLQGAIR